MGGGQTMIVLVVLIAVIGSIVRARYMRPSHDAAPAYDPDAARLRDEMKTLKERIQVLERVITDDRKSIDLDREIDRLRDR